MDLVNQMTLEEKVAQLLQLTANFYEGTDTQGQITGPMEEMGITEQSVNASGSILGLSGAQAIMDVQQAYLKKSSWHPAAVYGRRGAWFQNDLSHSAGNRLLMGSGACGEKRRDCGA